MKTPNHYTKTNFFIILCLSFINIVFCQTTFQKGYSTAYDCRLVYSQETADGNIIAAGNSLPGNITIPPYTLPGIRERIALLKINNTGDTLWTKTYGGIDHYRCNTMQQTMDNGFILGGRVVDSIVGDSKFILIKTDANGNTQWAHTYNSIDNNEEIFSVKETSTGDFVMAGNGFVGKVSASGNLIWAKDLKSPSVNLLLRSLDLTSDGGVILGGSLDTTGKPSYAYLIKMNGAGNIKWSKIYNSIYNQYEQGYSVSQTADKGFILTGATYYPVAPNTNMNHIYLVKTDSLGNLMWTKKFASDGNDVGYDAKQTTDGGYIVTAYSTGFVGNTLVTSNTVLIKTNATGIITWCKYYGVFMNTGEEPASVYVTNGGGYLVSGLTTDNMGYPDQFYLLKTDDSGNVNCHGYSWPLYDSVYVSVSHTYNQAIATLNLTTATPTINEKHLLCNNIDACTAGVTGLQDVDQKDLQISIFPNPANDILNINDEQNQFQNAIIEIKNYLGQTVFTAPFSDQINISSISSGIYSLTLQSKDKKKTVKVVKE